MFSMHMEEVLVNEEAAISKTNGLSEQDDGDFASFNAS